MVRRQYQNKRGLSGIEYHSVVVLLEQNKITHKYKNL